MDGHPYVVSEINRYNCDADFLNAQEQIETNVVALQIDVPDAVWDELRRFGVALPPKME